MDLSCYIGITKESIRMLGMFVECNEQPCDPLHIIVSKKDQGLFLTFYEHQIPLNAAAVAERIQGDPCEELGQGPANGATPDSDKREARLAREAEKTRSTSPLQIGRQGSRTI
eukprot:766279-Hanusia_phi.AAC.1